MPPPPASTATLFLVGNTQVTGTVGGLTPALGGQTLAHQAFHGRAGQGYVPRVWPFTAATLPAAPFPMRILGSIVAASAITPVTTFDQVAGKIVMAPGTIISIATSGAASATGSFIWEEVDA